LIDGVYGRGGDAKSWCVECGDAKSNRDAKSCVSIGFPLQLLTFVGVKKPLTIILLALFLLNVFGYYGVFVGLRLKAGQVMRTQFDNENFVAEEEVVIKVPITIPYASDSRGYERVDGEFEHKGQVYRLVKQKLQSDTLFIVCIKDNQTVKINQALADYVKTFTDKPATTKQSNLSTFQFSKDYLLNTTEIISASEGWGLLVSFKTLISDLEFVAQDLVSPPPRS
jgi:hypothetical protein